MTFIDTMTQPTIEQSDATGPFPDTLNTFIWNAVMERATDVHLHSVTDGLRVLYRVDGIVHPKLVLSEKKGKKLLNQIKSAAGINTVRSFAPIEGQIRWPDKEYKRDIRLTFTPIQDRESAHLRLLKLPDEQWDMSNLGLSTQDQNQVSEIIHGQTGLILIAGGTGSGKTTTMYSLASLMDLSTTTTYSIEDPVEFKLPFAQQIEVDQRHGLTMQEGLRTILRMDPDLIMIGEIRDKESAIVASQAALSGRMVLATIHAQDAPGAMDSLHYMGVPYHIIGSSLRMVIGQNLVRRVCTCCSETLEVNAQEKELFAQFDVDAPDTLNQATGCTKCSSYGFYGRTGIFEVMPVDNETKALISDGTHHQQLTKHLRHKGMRSVARDGLMKTAEGVTSMQELLRVCDLSKYAKAVSQSPEPVACEA
jgi:type II secretory ATPase GspE/PulE/Tfp pilus assembly ATPase PilB-like protein